MPHRKRSKNQIKRNRALPSSEQSQLQKTEKQPQLLETEKQLHETENQHGDPQSHLVYCNSNATDVSCDAIASNPLERPQTYLSNSSLPQRHANHLETQGRISLDNSTKDVQNRDTKQLAKKNAQQINDKTATQVDDESLLNIIESADPPQALQLLEGNNHFSQDGLDRALISACRHGLKYLVQELVRLGANVQFKDTQGNTPLLICAENGFVGIVQFLLKRKADVNAVNSAGDTALILSIRAAGSLEMVRVLLEQEGIDIQHQNQDGYTALMKAVEVRDVDVIKILMERHNKVEVDEASRQICSPRHLKPLDAVNLNGMTAEQIADKSGLANIYHILQTHLQYRVSPLVKAVEEHDIRSLQLLLDCHFVEQREIQEAFQRLFNYCDLKEVKTFTEKDVFIMKRLLECGAEVDSGWYGSSNSLSVAVKMGDYNLVELLCQHLDQCQLRSRCTLDALVAAATSGRCDLINLLLKYKADINDSYNYSGSPLNCAFSHGHLESAKLLIQGGAKIDIESALHSAVAQQLPEYMKFVFENYKPEVISFATEVCNKLGNLLVSAAQGGSLEIIDRLLDAGADVNQVNINDRTPLGESKDGNVAKFLISRGANVNYIFHSGDNLLLRILRDRKLQDEGCMDVLKVLLENGAPVNESGNNGRTPLMVVARKMKSSGVLQMLLDHGADINAQDERGNTALMEAAHAGCPFNVSCLLEVDKEKNLYLNVQNHEGRTALMYAATGSSLEIVEQLINCTADVNVRDMKGNTALLHAVTYRGGLGTEILTALIKAGSDVNSQNNDGFSPLMLATRNSCKNMILVLLESGADVNAVSTKDNTKTALSFLQDWMCPSPDFTFCLQAFLKKGASLSYINPGYIYKMIIHSDIDSIPELIQGGVAPSDIETKGTMLDIVGSKATATVSPLCVALWVGNVSLARYFVGNLFLTNSDVTSMTGNKMLRGFLDREQLQDCVTFLDELSSQPWSLFQLAFVAVSSNVGSSPGRENRVNLLPLPQFMKDKLLFKSLEGQFSVATRDFDYLEQDQIENDDNWFRVDNISSHDYTEYDNYDFDAHYISHDYNDSDYSVYYGSDID